MNETCRNCSHWQRHFPNDGGVCFARERPDFHGISSSTDETTGLQAIGDTMAELFRFQHMTVTRFDAGCSNFQELKG